MLHLTMLHLTLWPHYTMREKRVELLDIVSAQCLAHVNAKFEEPYAQEAEAGHRQIFAGVQNFYPETSACSNETSSP